MNTFFNRLILRSKQVDNVTSFHALSHTTYLLILTLKLACQRRNSNFMRILGQWWFKWFRSSIGYEKKLFLLNPIWTWHLSEHIICSNVIYKQGYIYQVEVLIGLTCVHAFKVRIIELRPNSQRLINIHRGTKSRKSLV